MCAQQHEGSQVFTDALIDILQCTSEDAFTGFDHDTIVKSTCQQLLTARLDSTLGTLTWALSLLLNNSKALEIAQNELDEHVGRDRLVEESDMKKLVYLEAILRETLRLYPPAPLSAPRESVEDCVVGRYDILKGTRLLVNLSKIHHDLNIWTDPYEFRPERFLTSHQYIDVKGNHFELLPFGSRRRMCPGVLLSLQSLRSILASCIQQFVLQKPSNEPVDMTESFGMTSYKTTPLEVLLTLRLPPYYV
nr:cytochrome P450 CYP82D47-like [Tanacetum cinerariifolium]